MTAHRSIRYAFSEQFAADMHESRIVRQERFSAAKAERRKQQLDPERLASLMSAARLKAGSNKE